MTLPSLIAKQTHKQLEVGLKKAYSNASQAYLLTKFQLGIDNINETYTFLDTSSDPNGIYVYADEFINTFYKNLKVIKRVEFYSFKNYNGTRVITENTGNDYPEAVNILPDGSSIGVKIVSDGSNKGRNIWISLDTNGPYKKPNRYGHDIFKFMIDKSDKLVPVKTVDVQEGVDTEVDELAGRPCSVNNKQLSNGAGCSWYAINDINPDDETKTYWDNLPK
ncbi:unknown [Brachyspira sp. CAG:484]|nr:unknown [Brachyspira sp. CAG:484]